MKKRILALLLAGIMAVSLASCIRNKDGAGATEATQQLPVGDPSDPTAVWQVMDDYVYTTVEKIILRADMTTEEGGVEVSGATKMHRISGSASWSRVEYNGASYFVSNQYITTDDLLGDSFMACDPTEMYALNGVNIRKYASSTAAISQEPLGFLKVGETVTVVAKGESWYKVKITAADSTVSYGFVFAKYLSGSSSGVGNEDFVSSFTQIDPQTMYVAKGSYYLRATPHTDADNIKAILVGDGTSTTVTVIGIGTGVYEGWSMVKYADKVEVGYPQTYSTLYVGNKALIAVPNATLDTLLASYPAFTKLATKQTMYVLSGNNLYTRTSPDFESTTNKAFTLAEKEKVTIVATGLVGKTPCYVIEYKEGVFLFVSGKYLTTNSDGTPSAPLTLDEMLALYDDFSKCTEVSATVKEKAVCFNAPNTSGTAAATLSAGTQVTVLAKDKAGTWYYVKTSDGKYYFAGASCFTEGTIVG